MTKARKTGGARQTESERFEAIAKIRQLPDWSVASYLNNLYELSLPVENSHIISFTDRITGLVAQVRISCEFMFVEFGINIT
jgi:hypothetical protein